MGWGVARERRKGQFSLLSEMFYVPVTKLLVKIGIYVELCSKGVSDSRDVFSPVTDYFIIYFYTASMFAFLLR